MARIAFLLVDPGRRCACHGLFSFGLSAPHLCPSLSIRHSTASPVNGALDDLEDDPAAIKSWDIVSSLAGLKHSTSTLRASGIAERSIAQQAPEGAHAQY